MIKSNNIQAESSMTSRNQQPITMLNVPETETWQNISVLNIIK